MIVGLKHQRENTQFTEKQNILKYTTIFRKISNYCGIGHCSTRCILNPHGRGETFSSEITISQYIQRQLGL